jgi:serine/threonine protein kinase
VTSPSEPRLDDLEAEHALEVDALCDDFERHWRRARRRGTPAPAIDAFLARGSPVVQPVLRRCLDELLHELSHGVVLPEVPGLVVEEEIGRGGMGVVYRARRESDGGPVALKLIPGAEHARWSRWLAELADLRHPHLLPLEAFGTHDGLHFVVMPLVPGGDLKERITDFAVGPECDPAARQRVGALIGKVAEAVGFLHRRGILHRDLKPSNILLTLEREPLVCDFGLAGRLDEASPEPGRVVGTPPYMAPEQMQGRPLGAAADVWSLGAVLYELLTGRPPFVVADGRLDVEQKETSEPTLDTQDALGRICLRCLRRDPSARYATAAELASDLNERTYDRHSE